VAIGVERLADRDDLRDAVAGEHRLDLSARRLETGHQPLELLVLAQFGRDRRECAREIVGNRKDVACKGSRGISARVLRFLFGAAADILGLRLRIEHGRSGFGELRLQLGGAIMLRHFRGRLRSLLTKVGFRVLHVRAHLLILVRHDFLFSIFRPATGPAWPP
jgi:hypothetical protein